MCSEISAKEFGILQSDVTHVKDTMDRHTVLLEKLDEKLDGLVLKREFEEYKESTNKSLAELKDMNAKLTNNFLIRIIVLSDNKILNFFAGTIFTLFIVAMVLSAMQMAQQFLKQPSAVREIINMKEDK